MEKIKMLQTTNQFGVNVGHIPQKHGDVLAAAPQPVSTRFCSARERRKDGEFAQRELDEFANRKRVKSGHGHSF
jgi:hypothetical protein